MKGKELLSPEAGVCNFHLLGEGYQDDKHKEGSTKQCAGNHGRDCCILVNHLGYIGSRWRHEYRCNVVLTYIEKIFHVLLNWKYWQAKYLSFLKEI